MLAPVLLLTRCVNYGCEHLKEYRYYETSGIVERKYIDSSNHARKLIVLKQFRFSSPEIEIPYFSEGLYDSVKAGDFITKNKGSYVTKVHRGQMIMTFAADSIHFCRKN